MAPKPIKKKTNFWEGPIFQDFYKPLMEQGVAARNTEQNRLNTLRTNTYGASGALAQNEVEATKTQNRIADEMAYRGMLSSGAYAGPETGRGTQSQADYGAQRRDIEQKYTSQANPMNLLEQGLKMNPDGSISPLAPGEQITDPATGEKVKYDWATLTSAGRQARSAALAQYATTKAKTQL